MRENELSPSDQTNAGLGEKERKGSGGGEWQEELGRNAEGTATLACRLRRKEVLHVDHSFLQTGSQWLLHRFTPRLFLVLLIKSGRSYPSLTHTVTLWLHYGTR